jgi:hypothetical protein
MAGMMGNVMQDMQQPGMPGAPPAPGMAPPPPPLVQYSVAVNGQTTGPFTLDQLALMAAGGQFTPRSMVWKQGMSAWTAAGSMAELAPVFNAAPPPPPPPAS